MSELGGVFFICERQILRLAVTLEGHRNHAQHRIQGGRTDMKASEVKDNIEIKGNTEIKSNTHQNQGEEGAKKREVRTFKNLLIPAPCIPKLSINPVHVADIKGESK